MCTVSFIPVNKEQFVLTSNRDERNIRPTLSPVTEVIGDTTVFFPKDVKAGGTWIAAGDNGRICCLLNGAFERHEKKPYYAKSRGKILLETFDHQNIYDFFNYSKLDEIEPFTLIVIETGDKPKLLEFRWDAFKKHIRELEYHKPYIWASATLYNEKVREQREQWFTGWLKSDDNINRENILKFHSSSHGNDPSNDVMMERVHGLQTVSITQIEISSDSFSMQYHDLLKKQTTSLTQGIKQNNYALLN